MKTQHNIRLDSEEWDELKRFAASVGSDSSKIIRKAIKHYIRNKTTDNGVE